MAGVLAIAGLLLSLWLLVNLKGVVGVWHVRLLKGLTTQYLLSNTKPNPYPNSDQEQQQQYQQQQQQQQEEEEEEEEEHPPRLFSYLITAHRNSPIDCDFNLHKSNSTFFADLDINRAQLLMRLFGRLPRWRPPTTTEPLNKATKGQSARKDKDEPKERSLNIMLGGVSCAFTREIKPLQQFEIWSRVLAWDGKWLFVVSYFVRSGTSINSDSMEGLTGKGKDQKENKTQQEPKDVHLANKNKASAILASSLTRYVFKDGRVTVKPEDVLRYNGLYSDLDAAAVSSSGVTAGGIEAASGICGLDALPGLFASASFGVFGRYSDL
ncbi:hypothetical protein BDV19DRAFT_395181 [Aspergillus venezuelensis]